MKVIFKIVRYFIVTLLVLLILINAIFIIQSLVSGQEMPLAFGYGKAVVATGSMEPTIEPGDMIVFHEQENYEVGDIVVFEAENFVTHRIVKTTGNGFITQGDANNTDDGEILREQMIGKVVLTVPKVGHAVDFLKSPFGILVLVIGLLALIEVPNLISRKSKRR